MSFRIVAPLLVGDNRVPGLETPEEVKRLVPRILRECQDFGLDCFRPVFQPLTGDEMSEVASYGGFPTRYPHWRWGMEYEQMQNGYEAGMYRIYEMVINNDPCYLWLHSNNTLLDNVLVIIHAMGHNHFFKNNVHFQATNRNMINVFSTHATVIRKYMARWGRDRVTNFIDRALSLERLIDPDKAWVQREGKTPVVRDSRMFKNVHRLPVPEGREYMDPFINPESWVTQQRAKVRRQEVAAELNLFTEPTRDILAHLRDHAPLKVWEQDILAIIYDESMYFAPQIETKVANEGFASFVDHHMLASKRLAALGQKTHDGGIFEYAKHKMGVLGGKWSNNPYKLGFELLLDIEERWDAGKFGDEWAKAGLAERPDWDRKTGQGRKKVFEVCKYHNDVTLLAEYFTQEFCDKHSFYEWKKYPDGKYVVESNDAQVIKRKLIRQRLNGGLPCIKLVDPNFKGKGYYLLEHHWDGRVLHEPYVRQTLLAVHAVWQNDVFLTTKNKDGEEIIWFCAGHHDEDHDVMVMTRKEYEKGK